MGPGARIVPSACHDHVAKMRVKRSVHKTWMSVCRDGDNVVAIRDEALKKPPPPV
jgi:hypothetical protein